MRESECEVPPVPIFGSSRIAVLMGNQIVTDKLGSRLRGYLTAPPLLEYLRGKYQWTETTLRKIDWITNGKYLSKVPNGKLTNLLKLQHGWQHTNERKLLINSEGEKEDGMADGCPLGCDCTETTHHYLQCPHQPGFASVQRETMSLDTALATCGTHPDLHRILIRSIQTFLTGGTPKLDWSKQGTVPDLIREAFADQEEIGWRHLLIGRMALKWKLAQHHHILEMEQEEEECDATRHKAPPRSAQTWATNLQKRLMHIALNRWQIRNEVYHDKATAHAHKEERRRLTEDIEQRYNEPAPAHPALTRLTGLDLADIISGTTAAMRAWRKSYDLVRHFLQPTLITNYMT